MENQSATRAVLTLGLALVVAAGVTFAAPASGSRHSSGTLSVASLKRDGWWIKVRQKKQESPTITFSIGSKKDTVEPWRTWNSSDDMDFDVPQKYTNLNTLYLKGQSSGDKKSWFCMMYKENGVQHFDFANDEDHEVKQSDRDAECKFDNGAPAILLSPQLAGVGR
jgi:hypothetical protein